MATAIIYGGPFTAVTAPDGTLFPIGVSVPVSDELAAGLLLQNFSVANAPAAAPATAPVAAPVALSGPAETPAIQAPAPAVSAAPAAVSAPSPAASTAPTLAPSTGVS